MIRKEMFHGTKASPASLEEYGIQPIAEAPATQMGTNMALFRDWWDAQHKDIEAENELRRRHNLPLTSREELLQEHEQRQADANKVWVSPNKSYASDYGKPGTEYSAGNVQSAGSQGSVATIDDKGLNLNVGRDPQMEYWHAGPIPQTAIQNIEPVQTGEPMNLAWQLLKEKKPDPRLKAAGVSGYNKPKRTPNHPKKSHVVVARSGGKVKTIRFGEQGADTVTEDNPKGKRAKKRASFKARHQKNIKRGPMSAAYWADKVKW